MEEKEKEEKKSSYEEKIDSKLLESRRIFLSDQVDHHSAKDIIRKLWFLELNDPGKPILFIINSPGGSVDSGFAVWDTIHMITSPVITLATGLAASMGATLLLAGKKGQKLATPNARIMIHQPSLSGIFRGQATDLDIQAREILKSHDAIIDIYAERSGQPKEVIAKALDRDNWMDAKEALEFGLVDRIVTDFSEVEPLLK